MRQALHAEASPAGAPARAHGRAALPLHALRQVLPLQAVAQVPPADPHGRVSVPCCRLAWQPRRPSPAGGTPPQPLCCEPPPFVPPPKDTGVLRPGRLLPCLPGAPGGRAWTWGTLSGLLISLTIKRMKPISTGGVIWLATWRGGAGPLSWV